ncbi:MAG: histidine triad protein [Gammaproteobacteria bacterium]|jgi:diadenosine tetraphosphate (Ap4A) HIT family hydrolase|nr:histidine triad protein [Gammaproteobacteria bacterium]
MEFILNPQIEADSDLVGKLSLSQLRLMNNVHFSWVILVPELPNITELYQLTASQQIQLLEEINVVSQCLKQNFPCDKLNIAMLGNKVSQLHVHIIARRTDDICWPNPVWGGPNIPYTEAAKAEVIAKLCFDTLRMSGLKGHKRDAV